MASDVSLEVQMSRQRKSGREKISNFCRQILRLNDKRPAEMDRNHLLILLHKIAWETKMLLPIIAGTVSEFFPPRGMRLLSVNVPEFTWTEFTRIHQCLELAWYKLGIKETRRSHPCRNQENISHKKLGMGREDQPLQKPDTKRSAASNAKEVVPERAPCQPQRTRLQQQGPKRQETSPPPPPHGFYPVWFQLSSQIADPSLQQI